MNAELVALERALLALATRSDEEGERLRHDVKNALARARLSLEGGDASERLAALLGAREANARARSYASRHGLFLARVGEESGDAIAAARAAQAGPVAEDVTLVPCPACARCHLCRGACMTTASVAASWQSREEEE